MRTSSLIYDSHHRIDLLSVCVSALSKEVLHEFLEIFFSEKRGLERREEKKKKQERYLFLSIAKMLFAEVKCSPKTATQSAGRILYFNDEASLSLFPTFSFSFVSPSLVTRKKQTKKRRKNQLSYMSWKAKETRGEIDGWAGITDLSLSPDSNLYPVYIHPYSIPSFYKKTVTNRHR